MSAAGKDIDRLFREMELGLAAHNGAAVEVEGVSIDLSFPREDLTQWVPRHRFGVDARSAVPPYLIFPWTSRRYRQLVRQQPSARVIKPGDRIWVVFTWQFQLDPEATTFGRYEAEADRAWLGAYIYVRSPDGRGEVHSVPVQYRRRSASIPPLIESGAHAELRRSLIAELEAATGWLALVWEEPCSRRRGSQMSWSSVTIAGPRLRPRLAGTKRLGTRIE